MSDATVVKSMADARETGLKVVMGSLEESRKSARIFIRVIYCLIVLAVASFEMVTLVTEHRRETAARPTGEVQQQRQYEQKVWMEANGDSAIVRAAEGFTVTFKNPSGGFTVHCVYSDGMKGNVGDSGACMADVQYWYVHDVSGHPNEVSYSFDKATS